MTDMPDNQAAFEELIEDNPELAHAFQTVNDGTFSHTLLEQWEHTLKTEMDSFLGDGPMDQYTQFLQTWPWLEYGHVERVRKYMAEFSVDSINQLNIAIIETIEKTPRNKEDVYKSIENDWIDNRDIYLELIPRWTMLSNVWNARWANSSIREKPLLHVAVALSIARLLGGKGLVENLRYLKNANDEVEGITDERQKQMGERTRALLIEAKLLREDDGE
jgi:hypothetical protein